MRTAIVYVSGVALTTGYQVSKYRSLPTLDGLDEKLICHTAVGSNNIQNNKWCRDNCLDALERGYSPSTFLSLKDFGEYCFFQHFKQDDSNSKGAPTYDYDACWSSLSSFLPNNVEYLRSLSDEPVETPADCQALCQTEPDCYRMQWLIKTKGCYMYNATQAQAFTVDRSFISGTVGLADDLCSVRGNCHSDCFKALTPITQTFPSDIVSGWKWCHPKSTDCVMTEMPMISRFRTLYCSESHDDDEEGDKPADDEKEEE